SEAMDQNSVTRHVILLDTSGSNVTGNFFWKNPAQVLFAPESKLQSYWTYQVHVQLDSIFDLFGNSVADSSFRFIFTTINADTLSSISGTVFDELENAVGKIYLTATQAQKQGQSYQISMDEPGPYVFSDILPGIYLIYGFRDADGNGRYSYGEAVPFIPAERFVVYPDSIKVRSRWPNEGNDIVFQK
ncbi:MAG: Ig-like domain-containing protein, partial [candidate division KSB1 bacterium]|nr:Ig-like domain-containing protein [candidate division KSB1 bacterium]